MSNRKKPKEAAPVNVKVGGKVSELVAMLRFASIGASTEETRYYLCGVRIDVDSTGMRVHATDGHRMHVTRVAGDWAKGMQSAKCLVKSKAVREILATFKNVSAQRGQFWSLDYTTYTLTIGERSWQCDAADLDMVRVVPHEPEPLLNTWADALRPFVEIASGNTASSGAAFTLTTYHGTEGDKVSLSATRHANGRHARGARTSIACEIPTEGVEVHKTHEVGFNAAYVRDILRAFGPRQPMLTIAQTEARDPALFTAGDKDQFVVLMPVRV